MERRTRLRKTESTPTRTTTTRVRRLYIESNGSKSRTAAMQSTSSMNRRRREETPMPHPHYYQLHSPYDGVQRQPSFKQLQDLNQSQFNSAIACVLRNMFERQANLEKKASSIERLDSGEEYSMYSGEVTLPDSGSEQTLHSYRSPTLRRRRHSNISVYPLRRDNLSSETINEIKAVVETLEQQLHMGKNAFEQRREEERNSSRGSSRERRRATTPPEAVAHKVKWGSDQEATADEGPAPVSSTDSTTEPSFRELTKLMRETIEKLNNYMELQLAQRQEQYEQERFEEQRRRHLEEQQYLEEQFLEEQEQQKQRQLRMQRDQQFQQHLQHQLRQQHLIGSQSMDPPSLFMTQKSVLQKPPQQSGGLLRRLKSFRKLARGSLPSVHVMPVQPVVIQASSQPPHNVVKADISTNTRRSCLPPLPLRLGPEKRKKRLRPIPHPMRTRNEMVSTSTMTINGRSTSGSAAEYGQTPSYALLPPTSTTTRESGTTMWCPQQCCRSCGVVRSSESMKQSLSYSSPALSSVQNMHVYGSAYLPAPGQGQDMRSYHPQAEQLMAPPPLPTTPPPQLPPRGFQTGDCYSSVYTMDDVRCSQCQTSACSSLVSASQSESELSEPPMRHMGGMRHDKLRVEYVEEQAEEQELEEDQEPSADEWYQYTRQRLAELEQLQGEQQSKEAANEQQRQHQHQQSMPSPQSDNCSSDSSTDESAIHIIATTDKSVSTSDMHGGERPPSMPVEIVRVCKASAMKSSSPRSSQGGQEKLVQFEQRSQELPNGRVLPSSDSKLFTRTPNFIAAQEAKFKQLLAEIERSREELMPPKAPPRKKPAKDFDCRPVKSRSQKLRTLLPPYPTCWGD